MQAYDSVFCGYFCIGFIGFMLRRKSLTDFTYLFSLKISKKKKKKSYDIILDYFDK